MDVDLQDPPDLLPEMIETIMQSDIDCVGTRRSTRDGEPPIRSFFAKKFYQLINKISDTEMVDGARDFRLMTRQMVDAILELTEYNRFSKGLFSWVGFKTKYISFENRERVAGETSWSFWKLFNYSIDGMNRQLFRCTINNCFIRGGIIMYWFRSCYFIYYFTCPVVW